MTTSALRTGSPARSPMAATIRRRRPSRVRRAILGLIALAAVSATAGCGSGGSRGDKADVSGTSLNIIVTVDKGAKPQVYTLDCDPAGGDHPQPAQACTALRKAG